MVELIAHADRPASFYIDADNGQDGYAASLADAAADGRAWACTVAADVLAWDLDDAAQADAGDALAELLDAEGWPMLRTASGRPGHRHLWAVIPAEAERARIIDTADRLGLPKPRPAMRPPLTPHRWGLPVAAVDDPATFAAAVTAVRANTRPHRIDWRTTLATGTLPATWKNHTGSAVVWAICIGAIREGLDLDAVRALLADPANRGGESYRKRLDHRGRRHADRWLDRYVWPSAVERAKVLPPADAGEARDRLAAIAAAAEVYPWSGKSGATDRAVLLVIAARGVACGSMTPTMSFREIAEAAPCGLRTVQRSVARLKDAGWLQVARNGRGRTERADDGWFAEQAHATRWRLKLPADCALNDYTGGTPPPRTSLGVVVKRARLNACRWGGLGLNAPRIIGLLDAGPLTAAEIADALSMNRRHMASRLLPKLAGLGVLTRSGDRWGLVADLEAALTAAAADLGLSGKVDEVAARHAAERATYADYRERRRDARKLETYRRCRAAAVRARASTDRPLPLDLVATTSTPAPTPEGRRSLPDGLALAGG